MSKFLLKDNSIYYLVFGTYKKTPLFYSRILCNLLVEYLYFYREKYDFKLYSYSIAPCHLNLLAKFKNKEDITNFEHDYKSYSTNQFIELVRSEEIFDYKFICGLKCKCRKFSIQKDNKRLLGPLSIDQITRETLQIVKVKNRIWRHKSWKYVIDNKEVFYEKLNYVYYNPIKHKLVSKIDDNCFAYCDEKYRKYLNT